MTIIIFLLVLTVLIFVHELGHFCAAKFFGVRVDEFAIGFPPTIWSRIKGGTKYMINLVPFGGYVKIFGETPDDLSVKGPDSERSLVNKPKWQQLVILLAGVFMNFVFAWILLSFAFNIGLSVAGSEYQKDIKDTTLSLTSVMNDSPADEAGLQVGDKILSIESGETKITSPNVSDFGNIVSESDGKIIVEYKRKNGTSSTEVIAKNGLVEGKKAIGISMGMVGTVNYGFFRSIYEGGKLTLIQTKEISLGIGKFIFDVFSFKNGTFKDVSGPVGLAGMIGGARQISLSYFLEFIAIISINLAVLNFIPFPALDGGRALFVIIELIIRKRIKPVIMNWANAIGFMLLMILMLLVTYKDIIGLIR